MIRIEGPRKVTMAVQNLPSICPIANKRSSPTNLAGAATTTPSHIFCTASKSTPCLTAFAQLFAASYSKSTLDSLHTFSSSTTPFHAPESAEHHAPCSMRDCGSQLPSFKASNFPTFRLSGSFQASNSGLPSLCRRPPTPAFLWLNTENR